jgi:hypothetical protein
VLVGVKVRVLQLVGGQPEADHQVEAQVRLGISQLLCHLVSRSPRDSPLMSNLCVVSEMQGHRLRAQLSLGSISQLQPVIHPSRAMGASPGCAGGNRHGPVM